MLHRLYIAIAILVFAAAHHSNAQILISNLFAGTNSGATSVSATSALFSADTETLAIGPGFTGTVHIGSGVVYTDTLTINASNSGNLVIAGGGVVGAAATFDATKTFTGTSLAASTSYKLTLTDLAGANLGLLSALNLKITQNGATIIDTSTGTGLGGSAVNLISLFSSNAATLNFTTGSGINTSMPLVFDFSGTTTAALLGSSVTFTGVSIQAVPEPSEWAMLGLGLLGLAGLKRVRLPRMDAAKR